MWENGNPLQCSCLENPRDRGAWWAAVYAVAQSQTQLKRLSSSSSRRRRRQKNWYEKNFEEIIVENFLNMEMEIVNHVQEAQRVLYKINLRRNMPRKILIKLTETKHKERILKAAKEKQQVTYKGNPICLTSDLSAETLQARREWQDIFKVMKGKYLQPKLLYPARISFKIDEEIKSFSDKQKLGEFSATKPAL